MKLFVFLGFLLLLAFGGILAVNVGPEEDCRSATPEEFKLFIEKDFRTKNEDPNWSRLSKGGKLIPQSVTVQLPALGRQAPKSIDWNSSIAGISSKDGRHYTYVVYYSCGRGLEYTGAIEAP